jgi:hypothetical protein
MVARKLENATENPLVISKICYDSKRSEEKGAPRQELDQASHIPLNLRRFDN